MPRKIYVNPNPYRGNDANSGLHPMRSKRTLEGAQLLEPKAGDHVLVLQGSLTEGPRTLKTNGVYYGTYTLKTERAAAPQFSIPKVPGVPNGAAITVAGHDNTIEGWDVYNADTGVSFLAGDKGISYSGNRLLGVHVHNFALAFLIKACHNTLEDCAAIGGRMLRDGDKSATGANAITVWKELGYPCVGTRIVNFHAEDCYAYAAAFPKKPDGSVVEAFGGIEDLHAEGIVSLNSGTFCEIGGTTSRKETVRTMLFTRCLVIRPMGRVLYVNDLTGDFAVGIEDITFKRNHLIADDDAASPFYIGAGHGDLNGKLSVENNVILSASQPFNAADGTDWKSIGRSDNTYWREGSKTAGVPLINGDVFRNPGFYNADMLDYRLSPLDARGADLGALGTAALTEAESAYVGPGTTVLAQGVGRLRGGYDSVPYWINLSQIPRSALKVGMRRKVTKLRQTYELQEDMTWLKVD